MEFEDSVSRTLLDLLRTTASNQVFTVGDGSTSAIVVANALFQILTDPEQKDNEWLNGVDKYQDDYNEVIRIVYEKDRSAFMTISRAHEIKGEGFDPLGED